MGYIHPAVSEIWFPQSLDPIGGKFDTFLAHGQVHTEQMGKCTTTGLDNSTELRMENIREAVTEIMGSASLAAARLARNNNTPPARRDEE